MDNQFGKTSRLSVSAVRRDGRTILDDVSFTAPYKLMKPFPKANGGIQIMPMCASAGIMRGDTQEFAYHVGAGADLEVLSQSFDKIHKMDRGSASRHIRIEVEPDAVLYYAPQPVIPFAQSAFDSRMDIHLADASSHFFLQDIISCGRTAYDERFAYRRFSSKVLITRGEELIYRDNTWYEPDQMPMEGMGMYEGYTHMANLFLSGPCMQLQEPIWDILEQSEGEGGVTALEQGDLAVRIFGTRAQQLQRTAETIRKLYENSIR